MIACHRSSIVKALLKNNVFSQSRLIHSAANGNRILLRDTATRLRNNESLGKSVSLLASRPLSTNDEYTDPKPPPKIPVFKVSANRLLLSPVEWIFPYYDALRQLPEVSAALDVDEMNITPEVLTGLERGVDIFKTIQNDDLYRASLVLLAACQQRAAKFEEANKTLMKIPARNEGEEDRISIARCKVLWLHGDCEKAKELCDDIVGEDVFLDTQVPFDILIMARLGQAINRLMLVTNQDDIFSVRDPFRIGLKAIQRRMPDTVIETVHLLNCGVAEAVCCRVVQIERQMEVWDAPFDPALRLWKEGLQKLMQIKPVNVYQESLMTPMKIRLNTNFGWALLRSEHEMEYVESASYFAGEAIKIFDQQKDETDHHNESMVGGQKEIYNEAMGRSLCMAAICYHKADAAVTAQGLFQSAIDEMEALKAPTPLDKLALRDTYKAYANLCRGWDKRERDAEKLEEKAAAVTESLPDIWKHKSGIFASLWF